MFTPAARGETPASHRGRRGAPMTRRDDRAFRPYVREEQRRQPRGPNARFSASWGGSGDASPAECRWSFTHGLLKSVADEKPRRAAADRNFSAGAAGLGTVQSEQPVAPAALNRFP